jgi:hypothetical protein
MLAELQKCAEAGAAQTVFAALDKASTKGVSCPKCKTRCDYDHSRKCPSCGEKLPDPGKEEKGATDHMDTGAKAAEIDSMDNDEDDRGQKYAAEKPKKTELYDKTERRIFGAAAVPTAGSAALGANDLFRDIMGKPAKPGRLAAQAALGVLGAAGIGAGVVRSHLRRRKVMSEKKASDRATENPILRIRRPEQFRRDVSVQGIEELLKGYKTKTAGVPFLKQDRPESVKKIYRALKRDHPEMSAEMKARIAARQGKPGKQKQGPPYKGALKKTANRSPSLVSDGMYDTYEQALARAFKNPKVKNPYRAASAAALRHPDVRAFERKHGLKIRRVEAGSSEGLWKYKAAKTAGASYGEAIEKKQKTASVVYRGITFPGYNKPIPSNRKGKKKMVLVKRGDRVKLVHFGQKGYEDYTQHGNEARRKNYLARSGGIKGKGGKLTANDPFSANYWARRTLWPSK